MASPLEVLDTLALCRDRRKLQDIVDDYEVSSFVVGLPLLADGTEGSQSRRTRKLAQKMLESIKVRDSKIEFAHSGDEALCAEVEPFADPLNKKPIIFFDERQSSKIAKSAGHSLGFREKDMRGKLDSHAAAAFLQAYLDIMDSCK
jgi:RNase H-fold protein (predicted Holliday junction resolvase)